MRWGGTFSGKKELAPFNRRFIPPIATTPFFFCYLVVLFFLIPCFVAICIIDFVRKTQMRKEAGLILAFMFVAAIVALGIFYLKSLLV